MVNIAQQEITSATFIFAKKYIPSAIIHAKDKRSLAVSLDAGFFSPVL